MPHFFFHLRTPEGLDPDEIGLALRDVETAYLEACKAIPGMAAEFAHRGLSPLAYAFVITDAAGTALMEVAFAERLRDGRHRLRPGQHKRARTLSQEIAAAIDAARETARRSREILARSRQA